VRQSGRTLEKITANVEEIMKHLSKGRLNPERREAKRERNREKEREREREREIP